MVLEELLRHSKDALLMLEDRYQAGFVDQEGALSLHRVLGEGDVVLGAAVARGLLPEWILQLPEVKRGLELGILENEEQAVESTIQSVSRNFDPGAGWA